MLDFLAAFILQLEVTRPDARPMAAHPALYASLLPERVVCGIVFGKETSADAVTSRGRGIDSLGGSTMPVRIDCIAIAAVAEV